MKINFIIADKNKREKKKQKKIMGKIRKKEGRIVARTRARSADFVISIPV